MRQLAATGIQRPCILRDCLTAQVEKGNLVKPCGFMGIPVFHLYNFINNSGELPTIIQGPKEAIVGQIHLFQTQAHNKLLNLCPRLHDRLEYRDQLKLYLLIH